MKFPHPIRTAKAIYAEATTAFAGLFDATETIALKQDTTLEALIELQETARSLTEANATLTSTVAGITTTLHAELENLRNRIDHANHIAALAHDYAIGDRPVPAPKA